MSGKRVETQLRSVWHQLQNSRLVKTLTEGKKPLEDHLLEFDRVLNRACPIGPYDVAVRDAWRALYDRDRAKFIDYLKDIGQEYLLLVIDIGVVRTLLNMPREIHLTWDLSRREFRVAYNANAQDTNDQEASAPAQRVKGAPKKILRKEESAVAVEAPHEGRNNTSGRNKRSQTKNAPTVQKGAALNVDPNYMALLIDIKQKKNAALKEAEAATSSTASTAQAAPAASTASTTQAAPAVASTASTASTPKPNAKKTPTYAQVTAAQPPVIETSKVQQPELNVSSSSEQRSITKSWAEADDKDDIPTGSAEFMCNGITSSSN